MPSSLGVGRAAVVAAAVAALVAPAELAAQATITGAVRDAGSGAPIAGALVVIGDEEATTAADGSFAVAARRGARVDVAVVADADLATRAGWAAAFVERARGHWTAARVEALAAGKALVLPPIEAALLLRALGLLRADASLPPTEVRKYWQVSHMVTVLGPALRALRDRPGTIRVVDAGCGRWGVGRVGRVGVVITGGPAVRGLPGGGGGHALDRLAPHRQDPLATAALDVLVAGRGIVAIVPRG